jgi:4-aminobutyrate aminotransferase-like enzyme
VCFRAPHLQYFNTFGGNAPAARAALAVLHVLARDGLQARAAATGARLLAGFHALAAQHACIGSVRGMGLMLGLEILAPPHDAADARRTPWPEAASAIVYALRRRRVLISADGMHGNALKVKPPMVFSAHDADTLLAELAEAFANLDTHIAELRAM